MTYDDTTKHTQGSAADDSADTTVERDTYTSHASQNDVSDVDTDSADISDDEHADDVTFEQDAETRENLAPDAMDKIRKLKSDIEKLKAEKQQYLDGWQRDKAEFINARKRDEESKSEFLKFALMGFAEELLAVVDSFESALKIMKTGESADVSGVEQIYNQLQSVLKKHHIESFGIVGDVFSPALHQAIGNIDTTDAALDNTVAEVLQNGYTISGKVIRPAFVKVYQAHTA